MLDTKISAILFIFIRRFFYMALGSTPSHINHILRRLRIREGEGGGGGSKSGIERIIASLSCCGSSPAGYA